MSWKLFGKAKDNPRKGKLEKLVRNLLNRIKEQTNSNYTSFTKYVLDHWNLFWIDRYGKQKIEFNEEY